MLDMHPQTLRKYERLGLVRPARTVGSMRLYSQDEIERLRFIKHLVDDSGVNLAGVEIILNMRAKMPEMQRQIEEFVSSLNQEMATRSRPAKREEKNSLIPVARTR